MPFDAELADRVRKVLGKGRKVEAKPMMGGLTFMVESRMALGILKEDLMVRFDPALREQVLKRKGARIMDWTKRPMPGFVFVGPVGTKADKDLESWVDLALDWNARVKPPKRAKKAAGKKAVTKKA
jgi:TfoX/Sxy family transcriptional regulator of competence genes